MISLGMNIMDSEHEMEENDWLLLLAQERLNGGNLANARSEADVMVHLGISEKDIEDAEDVEIE